MSSLLVPQAKMLPVRLLCAGELYIGDDDDYQPACCMDAFSSL